MHGSQEYSGVVVLKYVSCFTPWARPELEGKAFRSGSSTTQLLLRARIYDAAARLTNGESSILAPRSGNSSLRSLASVGYPIRDEITTISRFSDRRGMTKEAKDSCPWPNSPASGMR